MIWWSCKVVFGEGYWFFLFVCYFPFPDSSLAELTWYRVLQTWELSQCPKLEGADLKRWKYIHSVRALRNTSDLCCIVRECMSLKSQNSFKKYYQSKVPEISSSWKSSWASHRCERVGMMLQPTAPLPVWVTELGVGQSGAGWSTYSEPLAGEKWLTHDMFLGPQHYTLLAWHQYRRGFAIHILLSPVFSGRIPPTLYKLYSGEPPIESVEAFPKWNLNKKVKESVASRTDGPGDLIGLFYLMF